MLIFFSWIFTVVLFILPFTIFFSHPLCVPVTPEEILYALLFFIPFLVMFILSIGLCRISVLKDKIAELEQEVKELRDCKDGSNKNCSPQE